MPLLALDRDLGQYRKLRQAIQDFNATADGYVSQKIYQLQTINALIDRAAPSPELDQWLADTSLSGWEHQLQQIGVHRDASAFLKSIEFSQAMQRASNTTEVPHQDDTFYTLLAERDAILKGPGNIEAFESINRRLFALSNQDEKLQARMIEHKHYLALGYGKLEAIKDMVEQNFEEYSTEELSSGNNTNFFLNIEGEPNPLVIRVEDRSTLHDEADLQSHPVSEYFSEDYATMLLPFNNEDGEVGYQPVVLSQFASDGDLSHFAESLADRTSDEKGRTAQACFSQLSDFLIKLQDSGHYHPDIKLSNFLYDNGKVFCADRKTFLNTEQASPNQILTTFNLAPPEFREKVNYNSNLNAVTPKYQYRDKKVDMPSFMQYQLGAAINEYLADSDAFDDKPLSNQVQNLLILQTELLRENPSDRLNLKDFNQLLTQLNKTPNVFLTALEKLHPSDSLSFSQDIKNLEQLLKNDPSVEQASEIIKKLPEGILDDIRFQTLNKSIEKKLHDEDKALATRTERTLDFLGIRRVPERTTSDTKKILHVFEERIEPKQVNKEQTSIPENSSKNNATIVEPYHSIAREHTSDNSRTVLAQEAPDVEIFEFDDLVRTDNTKTEEKQEAPDVEIFEFDDLVRTDITETEVKQDAQQAKPFDIDVDFEEYDDLVIFDDLVLTSPSNSNAETELEQYSPNAHTSGSINTEPNTPKQDDIARITKMFQEMDEDKPKQEADKIATTIQRGDKKADAKKDLKKALNALKTEDLSQDEEEEENMKKPGSTPTR